MLPRLPNTRAVWLIGALLFVGCSDSTAPPQPSVLSVSGGSGTLSFVGETTQLSASVTDQHGADMPDAQITWTTSEASVATVSASGLVTAVANGSVQITASAGSANGSRSITVNLVPSDLEVVAGQSQEGTVAASLGDSLRVRVLDSGGSPIGGATIQTQVSGNGSLSPSGGETGTNGEFATAWSLGTEASADHRATIRAGSVEATFDATALPGSPQAIQELSGGNQEGWAGDPLDDELVIRVEDAYGNGVPEVPVDWSVPTGHGSISSERPRTDASGEASATWTVGETLGASTATVTAAGLPSLGFSIEVNPNAVIQGRVTSTGAWLSPPMDESSQTAASRRQASASAAGDRTDDQVIPGEFLVRLQDDPAIMQAMGVGNDGVPRTVPEAEAVAHSIRTRLVPMEALGGNAGWEVLDTSPVLGMAHVRALPGADPAEVHQALTAHPGIESVEEHRMVHRVRPERLESPDLPMIPSRSGGQPASAQIIDDSAPPPFQPSNDPLWPTQAWHYKAIGAWDAWNRTRGDESIIVAVVDDGIRTDHVDLAGRVTEGYSFVPSFSVPRCSGGSVPFDGHGLGPGPDANTPRKYITGESGCVQGEREIDGHGLHVAGTIAAVADNGIGVSGVAPEVRIMPVRVLGSTGGGRIMDVADGILYAAGLPVSDRQGGFVQAAEPARIINLSLGSFTESSVREAAAAQAHAEGVLLIAAAGNDGVGRVGYPAAYPEVMAVAAFGPEEQIAPYSNWGPEIEIAAPGGDPTWGYSGNVCSTVWDFSESRSEVGCWHGTSMAAPHVSAVAALVWSVYPGMSHEDVRAVLRNTANPRGGAVPNLDFGYGMVSASHAVWGGGGGPATAYVSLYDDRGQRIETVPVAQDGSYDFRRLAPGAYRLFAGVDRYNQGRLGIPLRQWSGYGGTGSPAVVETTASGTWEADIQMGYPTHTGLNRSPGNPDWLALGGYMLGMLRNPTDEAWFEVEIPESGAYVFQTRGALGACGLANFADTGLELRTPTGTLIASHESEDPPFNLCSRIEQVLDPGTYHLRVRVANGYPGSFAILAGPAGG